MKAMKKIIPMLLACLFAFSACVSPSTPNSSSSDNGGVVDSSSTGGNDSSSSGDIDVDTGWKDNQNVIVNNGAANTPAQGVQTEAEEHYQTKNRLHKVNVTETERPFVVEKKSDYKILVPADGSGKLWTAASFFQKYIREATKCTLPIESNETYTWSEDAKWIVFGRSDLFQAAGLAMPADDLKASGYYIKSVGDSVFVAVQDDYGYHRACLALLDHIVGYEMYWEDTVVFEKDGKTLPDMDIIERPDFEYYIEGNQIKGDGKYGMGFDTGIFIGTGGTTQHNTFIYLPKSTYQAQYPEWYSINDGGAGATQLCYTARGNAEKYAKMVETMASKVIGYMEGTPSLNNITITQEDVRTTCGCDQCTANYNKYKSYAASIIMFMNDVDDIIQAYLEEQAAITGKPKRMFNIVFFGYHKSEIPPAIKNADGTYSPVDENVICNPNVGVYIAPIDANYQHSFYEQENVAAAENIKGWAACSSIIYMWIYETNYYEYLYPINTWDTKVETYRFLKEQGTIFMHSQAQYNQGAVTHFSRLKDYVDSKAQFDVNVEWTECADAWFENYFGPAAGPMRAFFDQLQAHLRWCEINHPTVVTGNIYNRMENSTIWPKKTLDGFIKLCDQAYELIEEVKETNPKMYEVYKNHIKLESMFPRYAKLRMYKGTFTSDEFLAEAKQFKTDCSNFNINRYREPDSAKMDSIWLDWGV
ncbi:MAG: DUF4838 domain-containing protein [Clostridia bacterium]|nr:DUF4838 domain-containing protein [Clostridia bacterium]